MVFCSLSFVPRETHLNVDHWSPILSLKCIDQASRPIKIKTNSCSCVHI